MFNLIEDEDDIPRSGFVTRSKRSLEELAHDALDEQTPHYGKRPKVRTDQTLLEDRVIKLEKIVQNLTNEMRRDREGLLMNLMYMNKRATKWAAGIKDVLEKLTDLSD